MDIHMAAPFLKSTFFIYLLDNGQVKNKTGESPTPSKIPNLRVTFRKVTFGKFWL